MAVSTLSGRVARSITAAALALGVVAVGAGVAGASEHHRDGGGWGGRDGRGGQGSGATCGTASGVSSTSITVTPHDGTATTFAIGTSTTVSEGSATATAAALANGERVCVEPSTSSATTAGAIRIILSEVHGTVSAVSGNTITVRVRNQLTQGVVVSSTTTFTKAGATATLADVTVGEKVKASGIVDSTNNVLDALSVSIASGVRTSHVVGQVAAVSGNNVSVTLFDGLNVTVTVSSTTTYRVGGQPATLSDVTVGEWVVAAGTVDTTANALDAVSVWIGSGKGGGGSDDVSLGMSSHASIDMGARLGGLGGAWGGSGGHGGHHRR